MTSNKVSFISPKLKHRSEKTVDFYSFFQVKKRREKSAKNAFL